MYIPYRNLTKVTVVDSGTEQKEIQFTR
jgi:hypothetical protein